VTIQRLLQQRFKTFRTIYWRALRCHSLFQEVVPHPSPLLEVQIIVLDLEMDLACNGIIDLLYSVGCKEHDPLIILQGPQEHIDEGISVDIAD
jgi:hypothetical protein